MKDVTMYQNYVKHVFVFFIDLTFFCSLWLQNKFVSFCFCFFFFYFCIWQFFFCAISHFFCCTNQHPWKTHTQKKNEQQLITNVSLCTAFHSTQIRNVPTRCNCCCRSMAYLCALCSWQYTAGCMVCCFWVPSKHTSKMQKQK